MKLESDKIYLGKMKQRYEKLQNEQNNVAVHKINTWNTKLTIAMVLFFSMIFWGKLKLFDEVQE